MDNFLENGPKNPIKIQDNTFRDGHQSLLATRMRTEDMLPIAERMIRSASGQWRYGVEPLLTPCTVFLAKTPLRGSRHLKNISKRPPFQCC
jgi:pyruvate/oxaloacetate carboxyltransferase